MEKERTVFRRKDVRKAIREGEWWFSISDAFEPLTDSTDPKQYGKKLRQRDSELKAHWGTICTRLATEAPDGKMRETNCANTEGFFHIVQPIPSPKAEPFKRWLAKVGYEGVEAIEDPELGTGWVQIVHTLLWIPQMGRRFNCKNCLEMPQKQLKQLKQLKEKV